MTNNDRPLTFWEFFNEVFCPFNRLELPRKSMHKAICDTLEGVMLGAIRKRFVVINVPPRTGKTKICEAWICWGLTYFPESQWIYTCYSANLATESARYVRDTMAQEWYISMFGPRLGTLLQSDRFNTLAKGNVFSDGTDGSLTGRGAGLKRSAAGGGIVIDDPAKPGEALSTVERDKLVFWFENTILSRVNSPNTPIVLCAQRLAPDDLCGFLLENYADELIHLKFPAMVNGESVIPETKSTEGLIATQRVNPFAFAAQYMQDPVVLGGNLIKTEWFPRYNIDELESIRFEQKIIAADTALKTKTSNDKSVMGCFGVIGKTTYLIDVFHAKVEGPELLIAAKSFFAKHHNDQGVVRAFYIEDASSGAGLIQELKRVGLPVKEVQRMKDKVTRVQDVLPYWATGRILFPRDGDAPWLVPMLNELAAFRGDGKSRHDDFVDMLELGTSKTLGKTISILDVL